MTVNMICGVGAARLTNSRGTPSPAMTSENQMADSRLRKRRSYPMQKPFWLHPSRFMRRATAQATRRILARVNSSPMTARQPPVPNAIMLKLLLLCLRLRVLNAL